MKRKRKLAVKQATQFRLDVHVHTTVSLKILSFHQNLQNLGLKCLFRI